MESKTHIWMIDNLGNLITTVGKTWEFECFSSSQKWIKIPRSVRLFPIAMLWRCHSNPWSRGPRPTVLIDFCGLSKQDSGAGFDWTVGRMRAIATPLLPGNATMDRALPGPQRQWSERSDRPLSKVNQMKSIVEKWWKIERLFVRLTKSAFQESPKF